MTPNEQDPGRGRNPAPADKVLDHTRLQLSALIDGELPLDEARFLLRRLEHDSELRDCWERWQLCGDVLRGRIGVYARDGLGERIADAISAEPVASPEPLARQRRWLRLGGGAALAASVAVIALFLTRQSPEVRSPAAGQPLQVASAPPPTPVQWPATAPAPQVPGRAAEVASALAVADVPRRLATRRSRGQSQRAAVRSPTRTAIENPVAVAAATTPFSTPAAAVDPFSGEQVRLPNRPWPRALLPAAPANGAFTVDYGSRTDTGLRPLSPFAPRPFPHPRPAPGAAEPDAPVP
jgi:negative regulator of sigma E activity